MKTALILGVSGQDGAYLSKFLLHKGYRVVGTSRDALMSTFSNLARLGIQDQIEFESVSIIDFRSVLQVVQKVEPDEIYNLTAQSSVGLSFDQPIETFESISTGTLNLLEVIRFMGKSIKLYNASSSECFGNTIDFPANESTPYRPRSPYAVAKAAAFWEVANYREAYDIFACSGILFNHESILRPRRFVTQKIIRTACQIARGSTEKLELGNIEIRRDWGWAPEYVEAMWLMLQHKNPDDFIIATGETNSLEDFIKTTFSILHLNWHDHVIHNPNLLRPLDILVSRANVSKAEKELGWKAKFKMFDVIKVMVEDVMNQNT